MQVKRLIQVLRESSLNGSDRTEKWDDEPDYASLENSKARGNWTSVHSHVSVKQLPVEQSQGREGADEAEDDGWNDEHEALKDDHVDDAVLCEANHPHHAKLKRLALHLDHQQAVDEQH